MVEIKEVESDREMALEAENALMHAELSRTRRAAAMLAIALVRGDILCGQELKTKWNDMALSEYHNLSSWAYLAAVELDVLKEFFRDIKPKREYDLFYLKGIFRFLNIKQEVTEE